MLQETITSDVVDDIITLEFQRSDGTLVTLMLDSRNVSDVNTWMRCISGYRKSLNI